MTCVFVCTSTGDLFGSFSDGERFDSRRKSGSIRKRPPANQPPPPSQPLRQQQSPDQRMRGVSTPNRQKEELAKHIQRQDMSSIAEQRASAPYKTAPAMIAQERERRNGGKTMPSANTRQNNQSTQPIIPLPPPKQQQEQEQDDFLGFGGVYAVC